MKRAPPFLRQTPCWGSLRSTVKFLFKLFLRGWYVCSSALPRLAQPAFTSLLAKSPRFVKLPPSPGEHPRWMIRLDLPPG
jgi:hypothetical protein